MELDINQLLYRPIKDGKEYDPLFVKVTCQSTYLGKGMTEHSVDKMADWVKQYAWQTEKVAPLLKKRSLQATCNAIQYFLFWHFQYKKDNEDQMLRSPACSWYSRYDGIDCKSYSIIASCILTNLGISHSIRRVKQPGFNPDLWTHVYIIVPVDQVSGKLTKGHYVIDGTIQHPTESYIQKSDLIMSMKHYGLNGALPQTRHIVHNGYGGRSGLGISISDVKNYFSAGWKPSCIGGSLDANDFNQTLANVVPAFDDMIYEINDAVRNADPSLIDKINKLFRVSTQLRSHSLLKSQGDWDSACSLDATAGYRDLGQYYYNIAYKIFLAWLNHYFEFTWEWEKGPNNTFDINIAFDKGSDITTVMYLKVKSIKPKATTTDIKRFEITPYAGDVKNHGNFNLNNFLSGLSKVLVTLKDVTGGGSGSGTGGGTIENIDPSTGKPYNSGSNVLMAGGGIVGLLILAAGAGLVFSGMKNNPATKTATTVAKKKSTSKRSA